MLWNLDALRVVVVLLGAGRSAGACSSTSVALATALSILLSGRGSRASSLSCGGLRNGGKCGSRGWGSRDSSLGCSGRGSRSGRRATAGGSTAPNLGADTRVSGKLSVDVEENTWVCGLVCARERNTGRKSKCTGTTNFHVDALHVELSTTLLVTLVKGENLWAKNVVARCEPKEVSHCNHRSLVQYELWHDHLVLTLLSSVASSEKLVDSPGLAIVGVFCDFGPGER